MVDLYPLSVNVYPEWCRFLPRCQPRTIPFPRGSSVFLMGIVYTFGTGLKRGGDGHGGVRPRPYSYPTWTINIPPTIWRFPFGDVHYTWVHDNSHSPRWFSFHIHITPLCVFWQFPLVKNIDDFHFGDEFHLTMFVRVYMRLFKLTQRVRLVYSTNKPRLIPFQL